MSHFTRLKTNIRDKATLVHCLQEMGYRVKEGGTIRGHQGSRYVDVVVSINNSYEIGFVKDPEGAYELLADWWGVRGTSQEQFAQELHIQFQQVQEEIQREIEEMQRRVRHKYALKTSLTYLQKQGFQVVEKKTEADGTVKILARRWR